MNKNKAFLKNKTHLFVFRKLIPQQFKLIRNYPATPSNTDAKSIESHEGI
jgi:hypothetical protein